MPEFVRLDKWLWAVRLFKTRSDSAAACRGSAVRLNGAIAKPSAKVRKEDTLVTRTNSLTRTVQVLELTEKRIGAPLVPEYYLDQTPDSEFEAAREKRANAKLFSHKGEGRPTKKDRRDIERLLSPEDSFLDLE